MTVVGKLTFFFRIGARAPAQTGAVITAIPVIPAILARAEKISIGVVFALLATGGLLRVLLAFTYDGVLTTLEVEAFLAGWVTICTSSSLLIFTILSL